MQIYKTLDDLIASLASILWGTPLVILLLGGGLFFAIFSLVYFVVSYQLYKFKLTGKRLYMPMVLLFILLGFITETVNPMQIDKNFFYLFIFYPFIWYCCIIIFI